MEAVVKAKPGQYLTFSLQDRPYGVPIETIREINRMSDIAVVPRAPEHVAGVINLRGKVIPVVTLRCLFGFADAGYTKSTCIIVIEGRHGQVGVIVDAVNGVVELGAAQIDAPPDLGEMARFGFVIGVGKAEQSVTILIDAVSAVSGEHLAQLMSAA